MIVELLASAELIERRSSIYLTEHDAAVTRAKAAVAGISAVLIAAGQRRSAILQL